MTRIALVSVVGITYIEDKLDWQMNGDNVEIKLFKKLLMQFVHGILLPNKLVLLPIINKVTLSFASLINIKYDVVFYSNRKETQGIHFSMLHNFGI